MATQVQRRRGTTAQHSTFTGAVGEVTVDTDKHVVVVHDGVTAGGFPQPKLVDVQNSTYTTLTSVAGTNTITAGAPDPFTALVDGQEFSFIAAGTNTGAVTLNIDSVGAVDVKKNGGTALSAGDITSGAFIKVKYVSATGDFEMMGVAGVALSDNNTWTGTNIFRNAAGLRSEQAATQDAIALVGRAGGTGSYEATITPTTLTADRTVTVPDASGTMALQTTGTWTPSWTGFSADPGVSEASYIRTGNTVTATLSLSGNGTSNTTGLTVTLPFAAANTHPIATIARVVNNSGSPTYGFVATSAASAVATCYYGADGNWTASGAKSAQFCITYEV